MHAVDGFERGAGRAAMIEQRVVEVEENRAGHGPPPLSLAAIACRAASVCRRSTPGAAARRWPCAARWSAAPPAALVLDRGRGLAGGLCLFALLAGEEPRGIEQIEQALVGARTR